MSKPMGRPKIEIDPEEMEKLAKLQCTLVEIAGFFECSEDTIERRVKEWYGITFAEYLAQKASHSKIALRRKQLQLALEDGDRAMLIWLGKNLLDQKDKKEFSGDESKPLVLKYSLPDIKLGNDGET